jgi:hypothetical protein
MTTKIKLKRGTGKPTSLDQGEPAVDLTTGRVYVGAEGDEVVEVGTNAASGDFTGNLSVGGNATIDQSLEATTITTESLTADSISSESLSVTGSISADSLEVSGYNTENWDAAYDGTINDVTLTDEGILEFTQEGGGDPLSVDLDSRYTHLDELSLTVYLSDSSGRVSPATTAQGKAYALIGNQVAASSYLVKIVIEDAVTAGLDQGSDLFVKWNEQFFYPAERYVEGCPVSTLRGYNQLDSSNSVLALPADLVTNKFRIINYNPAGSLKIMKVSDVTSSNNILVINAWV